MHDKIYIHGIVLTFEIVKKGNDALELLDLLLQLAVRNQFDEVMHLGLLRALAHKILIFH